MFLLFLNDLLLLNLFCKLLFFIYFFVNLEKEKKNDVIFAKIKPVLKFNNISKTKA